MGLICTYIFQSFVYSCNVRYSTLVHVGGPWWILVGSWWILVDVGGCWRMLVDVCCC